MFYSRFQRFLSGLLIFTLLFSTTFRVPIFDFETFAWNEEFYNIVSVLVDEDIYPSIKTEIDRYGKDIQWVLENTKVVILPTPKNTPAFNIASLNESLYFDWYKSLDSWIDFESKLIGTVLVGDFNLPVATLDNNSSRTIVPFTDFEDKAYIYNHLTKKYEKNEENIDWIKSEIWHWVISPNFWTKWDNILWLKEYFNKNHDFYSWTWNFKYSEWILNWNKNIWTPSVYEPYVFYYDQFREQQALQYASYEQYKGYIDNKEDIVYNRFSKELADKISDKALWYANEEIWSILDSINDKANSLSEDEKAFTPDPEILSALESSPTPDTTNVPDIQTRHIIKNATKTFLEIFAEWVLSDFRKNVYNAWRYNDKGGKINADFIPYFVSILDVVNDEIIKDVNNELEKQIDDVVKNWLSRYLAVPSSYKTWAWWSGGMWGCSGSSYINFLYWKKWWSISNASECSIYRWSTEAGWNLVQGNRWLNMSNAQADWNIVWSAPNKIYCSQNLLSGKALEWLWGRNSPLNLNRELTSSWVIDLNSNHDLKWSLVPLFDITWTKKITDQTKVPSPLNCLENNYILATKQGMVYDSSSEASICTTVYSIPSWNNLVANDWTCTTDSNASTYGFSKTFEQNYSSLSARACEIKTIKLSWSIVKSVWAKCHEEDNVYWTYYDYDYKKVSSYIEHKSPTAWELSAQTKNMMSQALPIDKQRYVDFISAIWEYVKIDYPKLFNLKVKDGSVVSFETVSAELDKVLDEKSAEINEIIRTNNPEELSWAALTFYNYLKTGEYPEDNFDLVKILKEKDDKTITVWWESKDLSYYDVLVFSIYWNNLNSPSAKYAFVIDNYLNDQFGSLDDKYYLPKNKKQYEIAYMWAEWDAKNMYIKLDPEAKAPNPYADVLSDNAKLNSQLLWTNVWWKKLNPNFKCAPPDWVPIWKWIPAVICRLKNMLPPTISISDWACWPSLLSEEEKEELVECSWDVNKNWVNDCIETKLEDWTITLYSDSEKYYYNKTGKLRAIIKDKDDKTVRIANSTDVYFEIVKLEAPKDLKKEFTSSNTSVVYDAEDEYKNDKSLTVDYVVFKDLKIRAQAWVADYSIWLKNKDSNIFLKAYVKINDAEGKEAIFIESDILEIQVRWDRLFNTSYRLDNTDTGLDIDIWASSLKVSDKTNVFLTDGTTKNINTIKDLVATTSTSDQKALIFVENLSITWTKLPISYPLEVSLFEWEELVEKVSVTKKDLELFKWLFALQKTGNYKLEIVDSAWFKTVKNLVLLPEVADRLDINLWTSVIESGWVISTNFVTIYDKFDNPVEWEYFNLDFSLWGDSVVFSENNNKTFSTSTIEWYKIVRLQSTQTSGITQLNVSLKDSDAREILTASKQIKVLDEVNLLIEDSAKQVKVWWDVYSYKLSLRDKNNNIISDFDSRAYLISNDIFLEAVNPYVEFVWGETEIEFVTKNLAGKNIPVEFQVEWLNNIVSKNITIFPEAPIKMDLSLSNSKIEASSDAVSILDVELKDRYNNLVFNDNSTNTSIEILEKYANIITSDKNSVKVSEGKARYKIYWTINPWVAYFKISTDPSLENNSFIVDDGKSTIEIKWVWENVWKIETFYFWNEEKLEGKRYNSIYTTLLWSNYWDIKQQNYLAWSLLFNGENRALAVTSLLNNSYRYNNIANIWDSWSVQKIYSENDLSQDMEFFPVFDNKKLALNLYNEALNIYLWKLYYNFDENTNLSSCKATYISDCFDKQKTSIALKSSSDKYNTYLSWDKLILRDIYGKTLLEILDDGTINRLWSVDFEFDKNNIWDYLSINVKTWSSTIANLAFSFIDSSVNISRDESVFNSKIVNLKNTILLYLKTSSYWTYSSVNQSSSSKVIYYNDPFDSEYSLDWFTKTNQEGYENFVKSEWLWWEKQNKTLLAFSAWKTVGESVQDYMSFSVINLWDPVISLKKKTKKLPWVDQDRKFDSTIWRLITKDDNVLWYRVFDYDADSKSDVLIIKDDKTFKILENKDKNKPFIDKWDLAFIVDLWSNDLVETWDFSWDGFDDIFFVDDDWVAYLLNNVSKDFSRQSLKDNFDLSWVIIRAESFDMDADGITDIVTLDDAWEVNIFYWGGDSLKPKFTKQTISKDNGIKLNSETRNDNSLIYYDSLYQPSFWDIDRQKIDNYIFVKYPYLKPSEKEETKTEESLVNKTITSFKDLDLSNIDMSNIDMTGFDEQEFDTESSSNEIPSIYFIKTEYSEYAGIKVEKTFIDKNGWFIKRDDTVEVKIRLTNTSSGTLQNVVFAEKVPNILNLDKQSIESEDVEFYLSDWELWHHFLIDGFDIYRWETLTFTYEAKVRPLKHSNLEVWHFEKWELWEDIYWDVIIKPDDKNCSNPVDIFRSLWYRSYGSRSKKEPTCDEDKIQLPSEIAKNVEDADGNWVPDYIDNLTSRGSLEELTDTSKTSDIQDFAQEHLEEMNTDSDNDWVPDGEDSFNMDWSITVNLWVDVAWIEEWLDSIESFLNWLKCWFWNAWCISSPLNWVPLAPWDDPTFMGYPVWDWLWIGEWIPIFSALTWLPLYGPWGCIPIPTVWPPSPFWLINFSAMSLATWGGWIETVCDTFWWWALSLLMWLWAWGYLGTMSPTNFVRIFVTPTLTWGIWTAICFWGPAQLFWRIPPLGMSPLVPGWNCIVVAKKFSWCEDDWSYWDAKSVWIPVYSWDGSFGLINWNCPSDWQKEAENKILSKEKIEIYLEEADRWYIWEIFDILPWDFKDKPQSPLFIDWGSSDISVKLDLEALKSWNFEDVIKITQTRISAFPQFLMDWVTRQIEEIANKLTDFPTVYIILPDFWGILEWDWSALKGKDKNKESWDLLTVDKALIEDNEYIDEETKQTLQSSVDDVNNFVKKSGIKEAYEFISTTPLIQLEEEKVHMTLPWISKAELYKTIANREATITQRETELERFKNTLTPEQLEDKVNLWVILEFSNLINSLRQNLEVIKEYKEIPEKINSYLNKKEEYLEQILCNIETISTLLWGRIWKNGDRFKTWVELYILIKAILKSWQTLVDVFKWYKQECSQCTNERQDLLHYLFELIGMLIPKIPIIKFPKWPDIIIDLHNIRAWLNIALPEFEINTKPILLPTLPELFLPDVPNLNFAVNLNLPKLPVLPSIEIPELPDIPSLPKVELPDLPPPPKLPALLSSIAFILDILRLVFKAMCLLQISPLHPEQRAGQQISYLTERSWYLWTDFLSLSLPEFSFPFIDAVKVTSYVNLEFEVDFLVEMAKQVAEPINSFSNDFTNVLQIDQKALDFRDVVPDSIDVNINVWEDGVDTDIWASLDSDLKLAFAQRVSMWILRIAKYMDENKDKTVDNLEFRKLVQNSLASKSVTESPEMDKLREIWNRVEKQTYSKEEKLIKELQENNTEKFEVLKDIINTEIIRNKDLKKKLKSTLGKTQVTKVSFDNPEGKIDNYNKKLSKYNEKFIESAKKLVNSNGNSMKQDLQEDKDELIDSIKTPLQEYSAKMTENLYVNATPNTVNSNSIYANSCQAQAWSEYKYNYEWLYTIEWNTSYRLFDYTDELYWDEVTEMMDVDNDGDEDVLYYANGQLFWKENLDKKDTKTYLSTNPIVLDSEANKFYNGDVFYESVNNFREIWTETGSVNLYFSSPSNPFLNKFRLWFYTIIDKYLNEGNNDYRPKFIKKDIVDAVADIEGITKTEENTLFIKRNNLVYIKNVWNLSWVRLKTLELLNIKDDIISNSVVNITKGTSLYAWSNSFSIDYKIEGSEDIYKLTVSGNTNIELLYNISIIWISWDAYVSWMQDVVYEWIQLREFLGKPLFPWATIEYVWNNFEAWEQSYIDLEYHDNSELWLDFDMIKSWELYDLWYSSKDHYIRLDRDNDYYYAKITAFNDNVESSLSKQVLLSPQIESDDVSPGIDMPFIRVPVYQKQLVDLTSYIYENSWINNIDSLTVDLDLEVDSDNDWNTKNDDDSGDNLRVIYSPISIKLEVWEFDKIFRKDIGITIKDYNWNIWYNEVSLDVYSPTPEIDSYSNSFIEWTLNEKLTDEPVNIYRYRWWKITRLEDVDGKIETRTNNWVFSFEVSNTWTWLFVYKNDNPVAFVNENTWKIDISDYTLKTEVLSSNNKDNDTWFAFIKLKDAEVDIFWEFIRLNSVSKVDFVDDFENITKEWIYFKFTNTSKYSYYTLPETLKYNPWALVVYRLTDLTKSELFTIFKDWRINTINDYYTIEYDTYNDYVVLKLIDWHFKREVAKVLFVLDGDYIMK